jgi:ketosteroid isomerase-like protein
MSKPIDRRSFTAIGLTGAAALLAGDASAAQAGKGMNRAASLAEIAEARRRFAEAIFKRDVTSLPSFFTADTIVMPAGRPLAQGRDDVVAFWTKSITSLAKPLRSEFDAVDTLFEGDLAVECGRATVYAVDGAQEQLIDHGKYIVVWKREDGQWKRHRDIFNSDDAPKA